MTKPTVAENADAIVTITMTETAAGDETDGHNDDDQRWAKAVIASLPSRSREARKALAEALLDGGSSMPLLAPFSDRDEIFPRAGRARGACHSVLCRVPCAIRLPLLAGAREGCEFTKLYPPCDRGVM